MLELKVSDFFKGIQKEAVVTSTRMVYIIILFCAVVLFGSYTASLMTELSAYIVTMPFSDLTDLYENTDIRVGSLPGTQHSFDFEVIQAPIQIVATIPPWF